MWVAGLAAEQVVLQLLRCQPLYWCTSQASELSKASKIAAGLAAEQVVQQHLRCQHLFFFFYQ